MHHVNLGKSKLLVTSIRAVSVEWRRQDLLGFSSEENRKTEIIPRNRRLTWRKVV